MLPKLINCLVLMLVVLLTGCSLLCTKIPSILRPGFNTINTLFDAYSYYPYSLDNGNIVLFPKNAQGNVIYFDPAKQNFWIGDKFEIEKLRIEDQSVYYNKEKILNPYKLFYPSDGPGNIGVMFAQYISHRFKKNLLGFNFILSKNGRIIATKLSSPTLYLYDIKADALKTLELKDINLSSKNIVYDFDGSRVLSFSPQSHHLSLQDIEHNTTLWTIKNEKVNNSTFPISIRNDRYLITNKLSNLVKNNKDARVIDKNSGKLLALSKLNFNRSSFMLEVLADGDILLMGGIGKLSTTEGKTQRCSPGFAYLSSVERYFVKTNRFEVVGRMNYPRAFGYSTITPDGHILVIGGEYCDEHPWFLSDGDLGTSNHRIELFVPSQLEDN